MGFLLLKVLKPDWPVLTLCLLVLHSVNLIWYINYSLGEKIIILVIQLWTYLRTSIPALVAESKSILSTPVPALPITLRPYWAPASITALVTFVSERTTNPSYDPAWGN